MTKLLFIGPYPPPFGGVSSHLYDILPKLMQMGFKATTLTSAKTDKHYSDENGTHIYLSLTRYFFRHSIGIFFNILRKFLTKSDLPLKEYFSANILAHKVNSLNSQNQYDHIIIYTIKNGLVIPLIESKKNITSIHLMIFGAFYLEPSKYVRMRDYLQRVFSLSKSIIASSDYCAASIKHVLNLDFKVTTIYVGVDAEYYNPSVSEKGLREEIHVPSNGKVLLFLGRMDSSMGLDYIVNVIHDILDISEDVYVVIAGAVGSLSPEVEAMAKNDDRIKYCPNISFSRKPSYYALSSVVLAPTSEKHACMGVTIKEAMACGKPVIASNSGGIPEAITNNENGYCIPFLGKSLNQSEFIGIVQTLLREDKLRSEIGHNAVETIRNKFLTSHTIAAYKKMLV